MFSGDNYEFATHRKDVAKDKAVLSKLAFSADNDAFANHREAFVRNTLFGVSYFYNRPVLSAVNFLVCSPPICFIGI